MVVVVVIAVAGVAVALVIENVLCTITSNV